MKRVHPSDDSDSNSDDDTSTMGIQPEISRIPDALIQREWRHRTETSLVNFIQQSPLKHISHMIGPDYYGNMSPFLVKEVVRLANPFCGVHVSLHATLETMEDICREAVHRVLMMSSEFKTKQSITLLCETLPMPDVVSERELRDDETLKNSMPLQVQHLLENDRHRNWLTQYANARAKTINVFTIKLGPGTEKATPETGRYVVSMLMPHVSPLYRLSADHEPHAHTYEELDAVYRRTLIELDSHKRMAKGGGATTNTISKQTLYEEAVILAGQLQDKRVIELNRVCDQQRVQIGVLSNTVEEMITVIDTEEQQKSMKDTVLVLIDKLKQSRRRNLGLMKCLQQQQNCLHTQLPPKATFQRKKKEPVQPPPTKKARLLSVISSNSSNYSECTSSKQDDSNSYSSSSSSSSNSSVEEEEEEEEEESQ